MVIMSWPFVSWSARYLPKILMQESEQNSEFSLLLCHAGKNIKSQSSVANGVDFIICAKKSTVLKGKKKMCRIN